MQAAHGIPDVSPRRRSVRGIFLWLGVLWIMGWLSIPLEQAISWSETWKGLMNGLIMGAVISPFYLLILIPVGGFGSWVGAFTHFRRGGLALSILFPALLLLVPAVESARDRLDPGRRFKRETLVTLPVHRTNLTYTFKGGLLVDRTDSFSFECPASETDALIAALRLGRTDRFSVSLMAPLSPLLTGRPGLQQWEPVEEIRSPDFLTLYTDETHTHVQVIYGTI